MSQQVQLTYTPIGGSSTNLTIDVIAVHGAAEPDSLELFPGLKHAFLDGSLSEQIAGARRNIEIDFGPKVSAANRRNLSNFWLSASKTLTCLCATPTGLTVVTNVLGGYLTVGSVYDYRVVAIDAIGNSIASTNHSATPNDVYCTAGLTWDATPNARSYVIYRKKDSGSWKLRDYSSVNSYLDPGIGTGDGESSLITQTYPVATSTISVVNGSAQFSINWLGDTELGRNVKMPLVESSIFTKFPI
jgi:hypothetical protein